MHSQELKATGPGISLPASLSCPPGLGTILSLSQPREDDPLTCMGQQEIPEGFPKVMLRCGTPEQAAVPGSGVGCTLVAGAATVAEVGLHQRGLLF